jgi:O-acetyl-ADP-ribose deacetylase (regulator of RNase III)
MAGENKENRRKKQKKSQTHGSAKAASRSKRKIMAKWRKSNNVIIINVGMKNENGMAKSSVEMAYRKLIKAAKKMKGNNGWHRSVQPAGILRIYRVAASWRA